MNTIENKKKGVNFPMGIISIILGIAVFKEFDFDTLRFKKLALGIVYLVAFIISIIPFIKSLQKQKE